MKDKKELQLVHLSPAEVRSFSNLQGNVKKAPNGAYMFDDLGDKFKTPKTNDDKIHTLKRLLGMDNNYRHHSRDISDMRGRGRLNDSQMAYMPKNLTEFLDKLLGQSRNPSTGHKEYWMGDMFKSAVSAATPFLKDAAMQAGTAALKGGINAAGNYLNQQKEMPTSWDGMKQMGRGAVNQFGSGALKGTVEQFNNQASNEQIPAWQRTASNALAQGTQMGGNYLKANAGNMQMPNLRSSEGRGQFMNNAGSVARDTRGAIGNIGSNIMQYGNPKANPRPGAQSGIAGQAGVVRPVVNNASAAIAGSGGMMGRAMQNTNMNARPMQRQMQAQMPRMPAGRPINNLNMIRGR
jgi:hypothetical protein